MDRTHPDSGRIVTTGDVLNDTLDEIEQLREQQRQDTELIRQMLEALGVAEAALSDIGDADREPGDDVAWCERRAADALPRVRAALARAAKARNINLGH